MQQVGGAAESRGRIWREVEAAEKANIPDGMSIPEELERHDERFRKLAEARHKIEGRANERLACEQAAYDDGARGQDQGVDWQVASAATGFVTEPDDTGPGQNGSEKRVAPFHR
jgi:hypothetical protein